MNYIIWGFIFFDLHVNEHWHGKKSLSPLGRNNLLLKISESGRNKSGWIENKNGNIENKKR